MQVTLLALLQGACRGRSRLLQQMAGSDCKRRPVKHLHAFADTAHAKHICQPVEGRHCTHQAHTAHNSKKTEHTQNTQYTQVKDIIGQTKSAYGIKCKQLDCAVAPDRSVAFTHWRSGASVYCLPPIQSMACVEVHAHTVPTLSIHTNTQMLIITVITPKSGDASFTIDGVEVDVFGADGKIKDIWWVTIHTVCEQQTV